MTTPLNYEGGRAFPQDILDSLCRRLVRLEEAEKEMRALLSVSKPAAPAQSAEPVGKAEPMPGASGFTMAVFEASEIPVGTDLYAAPQPSPTAVVLDERAAFENWAASKGHRFNEGDLQHCKTWAWAAWQARAASPQPVEQIGKNALVLTGAQLLEALDFIAPDRAIDAEQLEGEVAIEYGEGHAGKAMYCWCAEYPEEGAWVLDGASAAVAQPVEQTRALTDDARDAERWRFVVQNAIPNRLYASGNPVWQFHVRGESIASGVDAARAASPQPVAQPVEQTLALIGKLLFALTERQKGNVIRSEDEYVDEALELLTVAPPPVKGDDDATQ